MSINRGHQSGFPHQKEVRYYQPDVNRKWVEKVGHAKSLWKALAKVGRSRISDKAGFGNSEGDASDGTPFPHQHADACFQNGRLERNRSVATMQHPSITRHKEPSSRRRQEDKDFSLDVTFFPLDLHSSRRRISIGLFFTFFFCTSFRGEKYIWCDLEKRQCGGLALFAARDYETREGERKEDLKDEKRKSWSRGSLLYIFHG